MELAQDFYLFWKNRDCKDRFDLNLINANSQLTAAAETEFGLIFSWQLRLLRPFSSEFPVERL
jgi:hypothetical protein